MNYGLKRKVTLITGNQREFTRTSSWQCDRERTDHISHFLIAHSMKHTEACVVNVNFVILFLKTLYFLANRAFKSKIKVEIYDNAKVSFKKAI